MQIPNTFWLKLNKITHVVNGRDVVTDFDEFSTSFMAQMVCFCFVQIKCLES